MNIKIKKKVILKKFKIMCSFGETGVQSYGGIITNNDIYQHIMT